MPHLPCDPHHVLLGAEGLGREGVAHLVGVAVAHPGLAQRALPLAGPDGLVRCPAGVGPGVVEDELAGSGREGALGLQRFQGRPQQLHLSHAGLGLGRLHLAHHPGAADLHRAARPVDVRPAQADHFRGAKTGGEIELAVVADLVVAAGRQNGLHLDGGERVDLFPCIGLGPPLDLVAVQGVAGDQVIGDLLIQCAAQGLEHVIDPLG